MSEWRSISKDQPDWKDVGTAVELRSGDRTVRGELEAEAWFNGEEEIPIMSVGDRSIYDFEEWRPAAT